jgi:imidazolonepropionase-like amidohydrolase
MPGVNLHGELWFLWKGGLQIEDVLRAATIGNAEKLGFQNEVGSLEPGKIADLLVLNENPLDDIINTLSLKYTVMDGIVYDSDTAQQSESRVSMSDSKHSLIGRQIE